MKFHYIAVQQDGRSVEGDLEVPSRGHLLAYLAEKGLRPISVKQAGGALETAAGRAFFGQKITVTDKIFLTKYLSLMLKVGTDLFKTIDILIADFRKPALKAFLGEVRTALERGEPFYTTFAKHEKFFSSVFVSMVKAGEASGNLEKVFGDLSTSLEKEKALKGKVRAALVYPALLLGVAVLILIFLVTVALPKIAGVFEGSGFELPLFSRAVFAVGLFLNRYVWLVLGIIFGGGIGIAIFLVKSRAGQRMRSRILGRMPIVKDIGRRIAIQRFASILSSLLRSGMPITEAIEITADAVGEPEMRESLRRVSREGISRGLTLGEAFRREATFPLVVTNLIAISEKAGHLDDILATLAEFYESEIDAALKTFVAFIEPAMLILIAGVVGLIALAIIVPIYQLVGQF